MQHEMTTRRRASTATLAKATRSIMILAVVLSVGSCRRGGESPEQASAPELPAWAEATPERIVCLGSAVSDLVIALGGESHIVGVDTHTGLPDALHELPAVGYHRNIAAEGVLSLRPDLVIAEAETGPSSALDQLRSAGVPFVLLPEGNDFDSALQRIEIVGRLLGARAPTEQLLTSLRADRDALSGRVAAGDDARPSVIFVYARGEGLLLVGGQDTGPSFLIEAAGGRNAASDIRTFANLTPEWLASRDPEVILVTTRGLNSLGGVEGLASAVGAEHSRALRDGRVIAIDDVALLGFTHRMGEAALELHSALHPTGTP